MAILGVCKTANVYRNKWMRECSKALSELITRRMMNNTVSLHYR